METVTLEQREKAERLIAEHVETHRRVPGQWAGYPGICLICYLVERVAEREREIAEWKKTAETIEHTRRRTQR